jgi:hypothetical protein
MDRMCRNRWEIRATRFDIDRAGRGVAVYRIDAEGMVFHSLVFSDDVQGRSTDRAWEKRWDVLVWLVEGDASDELIEHAARENAAIVTGTGRAGPRTLSWTRGNRSERLFDHAVERLAAGGQPDRRLVAEVGYLIRNVYYQANGMNGTRMFGAYPEDHPLAGVYHVQMLGLFIMREFSLDLAEQMAAVRSDAAVKLEPALRRYIGVGNATGIGLNLVVTSHPKLISRWLELREAVLAEVKTNRAVPGAGSVDRVVSLLRRCEDYRREDRTDYSGTVLAPAAVASELAGLRTAVEEYSRAGTINGNSTLQPWSTLCELAAASCGVQAAEWLDSILLEAHPQLADSLVRFQAADETSDVAPAMAVGELRGLIREQYSWALTLDLERPGARHWVWYRSVEGEEPRVAERSAGHISAELNLVSDIAGDVQRLDRVLSEQEPTQPVGRFLFTHPQWRAPVGRVQALAPLPYHTVRANFLHRDFPFLDLCHFVLSALKGLDKCYPMGGRWVRGIFLQGAPSASELTGADSESWIFPTLPDTAEVRSGA